MKIVIIKKHFSRSYAALWNILGGRKFCCEPGKPESGLNVVYIVVEQRGKKMYIEIILSSDTGHK